MSNNQKHTVRYTSPQTGDTALWDIYDTRELAEEGKKDLVSRFLSFSDKSLQRLAKSVRVDTQ